MKGIHMKQIIVTNNYVISKITDELRWIKGEAERFKDFLDKQKLNDVVNANTDIYIQHIIESCDMIDKLIEIENI